MPYCVFRKCRNYETKVNKTQRISYHMFPTSKDRLWDWITIIRRQRNESDWMPSRSSRVCSNHFKDCDKYVTDKDVIRLKNDAVPIIEVGNEVKSTSQQEDIESNITGFLPEAREIIASVYRYLQNEYEQLKSSKEGNCDLSLLSNILKRTAEATGVNEQTVMAVLKEEKRSLDYIHDNVQCKRSNLELYFEDEDASPTKEESSSGSTGYGKHNDEEKQDLQGEQVLGPVKVKVENHDEDHSDDVKPTLWLEVQPLLTQKVSSVHQSPSTLVEVKQETENVEELEGQEQDLQAEQVIGTVKVKVEDHDEDNSDAVKPTMLLAVQPLSTQTAYNHTMADLPHKPMGFTDLPLLSRSNVLTEEDAAVFTSATPLAEPLTIAARKSKAQRQREYRQRIKASRTPAQVIAARKAKAERQRNCRLRKLKIPELLEPLKDSAREDPLALPLCETAYNHTMAELPHKPMGLTVFTSATPLTEPLKIAARKSNAQKQREYRQRIKASRTPEQVIAARKAKAERERRLRRRKRIEGSDDNKIEKLKMEFEIEEEEVERKWASVASMSPTTAYSHTMADLPHKPMGLTVFTSATPLTEPLKIAARKSNAQKQREYRQRIKASRTPEQVIAARKAKAERERRLRRRKRIEGSDDNKIEKLKMEFEIEEEEVERKWASVASMSPTTAYNHTMADLPHKPMGLTDLPLLSRSHVLTEEEDAAVFTSATPLAEPLTIAASKSKAQKQREYRQRIAAFKTPEQVIAERKANAERQRMCRLRKLKQIEGSDDNKIEKLKMEFKIEEEEVERKWADVRSTSSKSPELLEPLKDSAREDPLALPLCDKTTTVCVSPSSKKVEVKVEPSELEYEQQST